MTNPHPFAHKEDWDDVTKVAPKGEFKAMTKQTEKIKEEKCICGHSISDHTGGCCWNKIVIKGITYRCECRCFKGENLK